MSSYIDINLKLNSLGASIESISQEVKGELESAIASASRQVYGQGQLYAQQRLNETRLQYLSALQYESLGENIYLIYLDDKVAFLEEGYGPFDMKPGLLSGPKAKITKKGVRYNTIPFFHKPYSQAPTSSAQMELRQNLKDVLKSRNLDRIIKDNTGKPKIGVVARISGKDLAQNLQGLVKYQGMNGKKVESYYMTFRRVSDNSDPSKWNHPGWKGAKIFPDLEAWADRKIDEILKVILS